MENEFALNHWPILQRINSEFMSKVDSFVVIGLNGDGVILLTKDREAFWFGELNFGWNNVSKKTTKPMRLLEKSKVIKVAHGKHHILLLNEQGQIYSLGFNNLGQLGLGFADIQIRFTPHLIRGEEIEEEQLRFVDVRCGEQHSLALTDNGKVWTWGANDSKQVVPRFHHYSQFEASLQPITELDPFCIVAIECGGRHSLALTDQGEVYAWGDNRWSQFGRHEQFVRSRSTDDDLVDQKEYRYDADCLLDQEHLNNCPELFEIYVFSRENFADQFGDNLDNPDNKVRETHDDDGGVDNLDIPDSEVREPHDDDGGADNLDIPDNKVREPHYDDSDDDNFDISDSEVCETHDDDSDSDNSNVEKKSHITYSVDNSVHYRRSGYSNTTINSYLTKDDFSDDDSEIFEFTQIPICLDTNERIKSIAAGGFHTLLLTNSGKVYACGSNRFGQIVMPTTNDNSNNSERCRLRQLSGLPPIAQIACHHLGHLSVAMSSSGVCFVWGKMIHEINAVTEPLILSSNYSTIDCAFSYLSEPRNTPRLIRLKETKSNQEEEK